MNSTPPSTPSDPRPSSTGTRDHSAATQDPSALTRPAERVTVRRLAVSLTVLAAVLYGHNWTHSAGEFSDASHHLMNGIFVYDALHEPFTALADPKGYVFHYYRHYPAVNIGYYPPVFPMIEAGLMLLFGVSGATGQLAVLLMALVMTLFSFGWFRLRLPPWWAAAATALMISTPLLVYWGRDIMIEVPVLAFVMGAIWSFERLLRTDHPTWRGALLWALLTTLAIWTKQHALMLLGVYVIATLATRRWKLLVRPPIFVAMLGVSLAAAVLVLVQLKLGGDAVGHSIGFTRQHVVDRFNAHQWFFYVQRLPQAVGWPVLVLSGLGLYGVIRGRVQHGSLLIAWVAVFYLMHSYMKAQDVRYTLLCLPPLCALATVGLHRLSASARQYQGYPPGKTRHRVGVGLMAMLVLYAGVLAGQVRVPRVPSAYQRALDDLCERIGPFTCLVSIPQHSSRSAVLYRLAVDQQHTAARNIYEFGRIIRADQLLRDWHRQWDSPDEMAASLHRWNIKYILREAPSPLDPRSGQLEVAEAMDNILSRGAFHVVRSYAVNLSAPRYPVHITPGRYPHRTLTLYERTAPTAFRPEARAPIRPRRVPLTIP